MTLSRLWSWSTGATQLKTKTSSGFSAFSPGYGAPEQFRSKKLGATGPWTDVHALGLILVEMVSGRSAFEGEEMADYLLACLQPERPTPRTLGADVSDAFDELCGKALALLPDERFGSAGELLAALDSQGGSLEAAAGEHGPCVPLEECAEGTGPVPSH